MAQTVPTNDGATYPLVQMHFHSPSETTFAGAHFPVELHFVNTDRDGKSVVVAVMVEPGAANPAWQPYIDALGLAKGDSKNVNLDWSKLLPTDRTQPGTSRIVTSNTVIADAAVLR